MAISERRRELKRRRQRREKRQKVGRAGGGSSAPNPTADKSAKETEEIEKDAG